MNFSALWIPGLLVAVVLIVHALVPGWSMMAIIALIAPLLTVIILVVREGRSAGPLLRKHLTTGLTGSVNELALFLAAGVLAAGLVSLTGILGDWLPFARFGPIQASLLLALMVGIAALGVHPVISIAVCGAWLTPLHPNANLLAITLLMAWAIGVPANPLSGLHLIMQGRYRIDGYAFLRWNAAYVLKCLGAAVALLHLYALLLGVAA